ncbi:hypothetical protein [Streptomyces sp. NPDC002559]
MAPRFRPARLVAAAVLSAGIALGAAGTAHADLDVDYSSNAEVYQSGDQSGDQSWSPANMVTWSQDSHVNLFD